MTIDYNIIFHKM